MLRSWLTGVAVKELEDRNVLSYTLAEKLEVTMKFRSFQSLLTLALVVSSPLMAHARACNDSTIKGSYAFTIHGTLFLPNGTTVVVDGIARETYDGRGNETQVDAVAMNGILDAPGWRPSTGTYSVNPDCTGTQTIFGPPGLPDLHLQFIVAQSGNTIHQVVTNPGFATTAEGERLGSPENDD